MVVELSDHSFAEISVSFTHENRLVHLFSPHKEAIIAHAY